MAQAVSLEAKELSSIDFLKQRPRNERLDLWPFVCAYVAWSGYVLWRLVTIGTEGFYLIQLATYALLAIHAVTFLSGVWSVGSQARLRFRPAGSISQATHVLVVPHAFVGTRDIVPLEQKADAAGVPRYAFSFRKLRFVHSADTGAFTKLKYPSHDTVGAYLAATGLGSEAATSAALERWGDNRFEVPVPSFAALLADQLMAPFFCFQVFCVGLWALDEYWYYSLFTLFMLVTFECTVVVQRLKNLNDVRALQTPKEALNVYRGGKWAKIPGDSLLPGDVVSMLRDDSGNDLVVQADMLLLAGSCIVDEAVLTGESTPQWKSAIDENDEGGAEARLSIKRDKAHVLFGGTKVLQTTGERAARLKTPDNGCLAVVLRTGFGTAQGRLMRTILYSTEKVSANNVETFLFIAFLLVWAIAASGYVLYYGLADPNRDRFKLVLNCIMILTSVVPPELPMELTIAVNASLLALSRLRIFCTEPFRIPLAGKVTTCCFDKTGTLTSDHFVLEGVVGCGAPEGGPEPEAGALQDAKSLPRATARVLAACQSLVQVDKETIGDPLEKVALEAVGWTTLGQLGVRSKDGGPRETVEIVHRYAFSSTLKRMSTLVAVEPEGATATKSHWVLTKGAPEVIRGDLAAVPPQYDATHRRFAAQGARVLALACRRLPAGLAAADLRALPRERAEAGLDFAGFAVFRSPLKPESEPTLGALRASGHQLVMITGDAPLTACHVAAAVHIVVRPALVLQAPAPGTGRGRKGGEGGPAAGGDAADSALPATPPLEWVSPDESLRLPFDPALGAAAALAADHDLCLTGDALAALAATGAAPAYVPLTSVFARVTPDQKELVVKILRGAGLGVLMCGDGTNDVGALRGAHVGVALLAPPEKKKKRGDEKKRGDDKKRGEDKKGSRALAATAGAPSSGPVAAPAAPGAPSPSSAPAPPPGPGAKMLEDMAKKGRPITPFMRRMAKAMDDMAAAQAGAGDEVAMVKPGDASMASPFTAKQGSVAPCLDILRQGRCTLVTTMQMFKILGLLCLSSAYSLSVMYMDGIKLGDMQATLAGVLTAGMFFFISHAKPLATLSRQRPHARVFSAYTLVSLLGQFAVHISFLMFMQRTAHAMMPREERQEPDSEFKPNLINTICFLVNFSIQTMTFAVNYVGAPFNTPLQENRFFALSVNWSTLAYVLLVLDLPRGLRTWFSLVAIPAEMQGQLLVLGGLAYLAAGTIERMARALFPAPLVPEKGGLHRSRTPMGPRKKQQ
ncbi:hypothetical protein ACKKBF_B33495 [Auxenochlorella protothecoides x Auxenochlorella symbiontica]